MTTAIVMNTRLAAVTEHTTTLQSMTQTHGASAADGLCTLGGDRDRSTRIDARFLCAQVRDPNLLRLRLPALYFAMKGEGVAGEQGTALVDVDGTEYSYPMDVRGSVSRVEPGKGINANYLSVGFSNLQGRDFRVDSIQPELAHSKQRKAY